MDKENDLIAHRWVRIMADTAADGVWAKDGCCCPADDLPVPAELIERIRQWQGWYERDENDWGIFKGDIDAFAAEGLACAKAVKAALPNWTVVYFDEAACARTKKDDPRGKFEFEVDL